MYQVSACQVSREYVLEWRDGVRGTTTRETMSRSGTKSWRADGGGGGEEAPIVERVSRDRGTRGGKGNRGIPGVHLGVRGKRIRAKRERESRRSDSRQRIHRRRGPERRGGREAEVCESRRGAASVKDEEGAEEKDREGRTSPLPISSRERWAGAGAGAPSRERRLRVRAAVRKLRSCRGRGISPACHLRARAVLLLLLPRLVPLPDCSEYARGARSTVLRVLRVRPTGTVPVDRGVVPLTSCREFAAAATAAPAVSQSRRAPSPLNSSLVISRACVRR